MRKLRPREGQGRKKPKGSQPKGEAASQPHICPTPKSMFLICLGGSWALGDQTLPLSRRTSNGKRGSGEQVLWLSSGEGKELGGDLRRRADGGEDDWNGCGLVLCGRLVILLF